MDGVSAIKCEAIPPGFATERLCYVMRGIIKHMSDSLVAFKGVILFKDVILSLRRIWRGADVQFALALVRYAQDPSGLKSLRMTPVFGFGW
jgi:hypothetical protein